MALLSRNIVDGDVFVSRFDKIAEFSILKNAFSFTFKSGRTIKVNSKPQMVEGKSVGLVWSFQDVTELLQAENELRTKIETLERLNSIMVDRELKMVALKKEIKILEQKARDTNSDTLNIAV